jgi:hypothetical protein
LKYPLPFFFLEFQAGFHSHKRNEELVPFLVFFFVDALISISFLFPLLLDTVGRLRSNEDTRARVERQKEGPPGRFEGAVSGGRTGVRCLLLSGPIWGIRILGGVISGTRGIKACWRSGGSFILRGGRSCTIEDLAWGGNETDGCPGDSQVLQRSGPGLFDFAGTVR